MCSSDDYPVAVTVPDRPEMGSAPSRQLIDDLVVANHILFDQGVVDGFGHVSVRHDKDAGLFLLARNMAPGQVTADDIVVSNGSCTTNALAPVAKVLHDLFGIERGYMTTIHAYTGDQPTLDTMHKDLYRVRAAALSMIPTSTGAAKAVGLVLPELKGKLDGVSIRVPTPNVSVVDLVFEAGRDTSVEEINEAIRTAANGPLKGILGYTDEKLVSTDFNHDPHSSVFHMDQTKVMEGRLCRILSWYDNEWGFSNRMADTAIAMSKVG